MVQIQEKICHCRKRKGMHTARTHSHVPRLPHSDSRTRICICTPAQLPCLHSKPGKLGNEARELAQFSPHTKGNNTSERQNGLEIFNPIVSHTLQVSPSNPFPIVVPLNKTIQRKELVLVSTALTVCLKQQVINSPHDVLYVGGILEHPWQWTWLLNCSSWNQKRNVTIWNVWLICQVQVYLLC